MSVFENKQDKTFTLTTKNTMYQMKVDSYGELVHSYYGESLVLWANAEQYPIFRRESTNPTDLASTLQQFLKKPTEKS